MHMLCLLSLHPLSQVTLEEATAKANQMGIMFMETSAKAGHNVKSLFKKIAMSLPGMEKETQNETSTSEPILPQLPRLHVTDNVLQKSTSNHNPLAICPKPPSAIVDCTPPVRSLSFFFVTSLWKNERISDFMTVVSPRSHMIH